MGGEILKGNMRGGGGALDGRRAGRGILQGGPARWGEEEGLNMTRCPITATDTVVSPPLRTSPLYIILENKRFERLVPN